jgi:hypothetical protein
MATFYLLPPRSCLDQAIGDVLAGLLPGLPIPAETWETVANEIASAAGWPDDVFLIPRDDLPEGEPVCEALAAAFGAEEGDQVVEVSLARGPAAARSRVLHFPGVPATPAAL